MRTEALVLVRFEPWKAPEIRAPHMMLAWALVLLALAVTVREPLLRFSRSGNDVAAPGLTASGERLIEPRLSGSDWAPLASSKRGEHGASYPRAEGSPETRYSAGITQLHAGNHRAAIADLLAAAESSGDARKWNDLAVAYTHAYVQRGAPELLADALGAADRALVLRPGSAEALFNRALVLQHLGLRDDARIAWHHYLATDAKSAWADEAREHLQNLQPLTPFGVALDRNYQRLLRTPDDARELARSDPQEARTAGVVVVVSRWAHALTSGNDGDAARHLAIARVLGEEIAELNGDRMLQQTVAAIDGADAASRAVLAAAHIDYARGTSLAGENPTEAEPLFRSAAAGLERGRSPFAAMAWFDTANAAFNQGRLDEAQQILEKTMSGLSRDFAACRAHLLSQLVACHFRRAEWGAAIEAANESVVIFNRLGEANNTAAVRRVMANIYDRTGNRTNAWNERMRALRDLGRTSNLALAKAIASIVDESTLRQQWRTAEAFLNVEIEVSRRAREDVHLAATLLMRAAVRQRLQDRAGAQADLDAGAAVTERLKAPWYRQYLETDAQFVRSMLTASPKEANELLTNVIAFQSKAGDRMNLPVLYLQRARALRKAGDVSGAARDLERGITELESQRESLPAGEARWGAFLPAEELFEEAITLALDERDPSRAFATAERARARSLLDTYGRSPSLDTSRLEKGVVVVEYAVLPERLVIFTADASEVRVDISAVDRQVVAREVDTLLDALQNDGRTAARRSAKALYGRLIAPIAPRLLGARTVVFVPDAVTATIPFGTLMDGDGQYLLEQHVAVVAPSAAVYVAAEGRQRSRRTPESVLLVTNAEPGAAGGRLPFVNNEAHQVAHAYPKSSRLYDETAQVDELFLRAPGFDVIHFAGHAIGDDSGLEPASIVLRQDGRERRLTVAEIAKLRLSDTSAVVLAGCSTARGERRGTEGVMSVAQGFLHAGVPSVIATLWPVDDDDAARFFPRIHAGLARGLTPAEALRAAQQEAIRDGNFPLSLWAAIQTIGS